MSTYSKPTNYYEMDQFINELSPNSWRAVRGAFAAGGYGGIIEYLRREYPTNLINWRDMDLYHYLSSRKLSDFATTDERI